MRDVVLSRNLPKGGGVAVAEAQWYTYVLVSYQDRPGAPRWARGITRTYVGVAIDVARRARQHNGELTGGARSTRGWRPWHLAAVHGPFADRGSAQVVEYQLKQRRGAIARLQPLAPG